MINANVGVINVFECIQGTQNIIIMLSETISAY